MTCLITRCGSVFCVFPCFWRAVDAVKIPSITMATNDNLRIATQTAIQARCIVHEYLPWSYQTELRALLCTILVAFEGAWVSSKCSRFVSHKPSVLVMPSDWHPHFKMWNSPPWNHKKTADYISITRMGISTTLTPYFNNKYWKLVRKLKCREQRQISAGLDRHIHISSSAAKSLASCS